MHRAAPYTKPTPYTSATAAGPVLTAFVALAVLAATALLLLLSRLMPSNILDGLTSPASFGERTT